VPIAGCKLGPVQAAKEELGELQRQSLLPFALAALDAVLPA
jgi:hypothetical protein